MGVMTITAFIISLNLTRKTYPHEVRILLKKLMQKDNNALEKYLFHYKHLHPKTYERYIEKEINSLKTVSH
jgi:hypothetical protein